MAEMKNQLRDHYKFYSQELLNNLFAHPYTKIEFLQRDLQVSRMTATRYLDALTETGFLVKQKMRNRN
jgi:Fic family protein